MDSEPDADQKYGEEIAYHLRRAFSPGDKNYTAQFLFARQLCISGKYEEATESALTVALYALNGGREIPTAQ